MPFTFIIFFYQNIFFHHYLSRHWRRSEQSFIKIFPFISVLTRTYFDVFLFIKWPCNLLKLKIFKDLHDIGVIPSKDLCYTSLPFLNFFPFYFLKILYCIAKSVSLFCFLLVTKMVHEFLFQNFALLHL